MSRALSYARLTLTAVVWGSMYPLGAYAVKFMSPTAVGAWRYGVAGLVLLPVVQRREGWPIASLWRNLVPLLGMAGSGVVVFNLALFYGLRSTTAVNGALIMALSPALTTVLSAALRRAPIAPLQWLGLGCGLAGVAWVASGGSWSVLRGLHFAHGDLLMMLAVAAWTLYAVIPEQYVRNLSPLQATGASSLLGAAGLAALALHDGFAAVRIPSPTLAAVLLYMAVIGTVLALSWWIEGVMRLGAARAILFMNLVPISTALISVCLGQPLHAAALYGALLVITGVSVAVSQRQ
jgi:drug/metabolite transporter (DMT)-like permease